MDRGSTLTSPDRSTPSHPTSYSALPWSVTGDSGPRRELGTKLNLSVCSGIPRGFSRNGMAARTMPHHHPTPHCKKPLRRTRRPSSTTLPPDPGEGGQRGRIETEKARERLSLEQGSGLSGRVVNFSGKVGHALFTHDKRKRYPLPPPLPPPPHQPWARLDRPTATPSASGSTSSRGAVGTRGPLGSSDLKEGSALGATDSWGGGPEAMTLAAAGRDAGGECHGDRRTERHKGYVERPGRPPLRRLGSSGGQAD